MDLKSFREFMWNKRRNEYLKLKYTERYRNDPEPWETIYKDVSDTAVNGLTERAAEKYDCSAAKRYPPYKTKRSVRTGKFIDTRQNERPTRKTS
jgi:hypothetical protein